MENIRREVKRALHFYDIFSFPLTPFEIYKNISAKISFNALLSTLNDLKNKGEVVAKSGYFFLPKSSGLGEKRNNRFLISYKKLRKAKIYARVLSHMPFVRFAGVCNSLGYFGSRDESDIDFFIIAERGHLWTARFFATIFFIAFKMRPKEGANKDKVCLSFFLSSLDMNLQRFALSGGDPYLEHWILWILPLYDEGIYQKFILANYWLYEKMPNAHLQQSQLTRKEKSFAKKIAEKIFAPLENIFKKIQEKVMPYELKRAALLPSSNVVLDNGALKFHLLDRREEYKKIFNERVQQS